ncbi:hypothetical protein R1sor_010259 [Riccia sorocarpa]|uniref:Reverse transcriptase zinc-binding domain-containing protein n=1 Tax=Riccia sorocarpa TaxID=122646 RepID=A0ABD3HXH3_9MARC
MLSGPLSLDIRPAVSPGFQAARLLFCRMGLCTHYGALVGPVDNLDLCRANNALFMYHRRNWTVHSQLLPEQQLYLDEEPTGGEITDVVNTMPRNKAPGKDGFSADALREGWAFLANPMINFVHHVWLSKLIPSSFLEAWLVGGLGLRDPLTHQKTFWVKLFFQFLSPDCQAPWKLLLANILKPAGTVQQVACKLLTERRITGPRGSLASKLALTWKACALSCNFSPLHGQIPPDLTLYQLLYLLARRDSVLAKSCYLTEPQWWEWHSQLHHWPLKDVVALAYRGLLPSLHQDIALYLNAKWSYTWDTQQWKRFWHVFSSPLFSVPDRLWIWRFTTQAFYTGARAQAIRRPETSCSYCGYEVETVQHLFFNCPRWDQLHDLIVSLFPHSEMVTSLDPFSIFLDALKSDSHYLTAKFFIYNWKYQWQLRCKQRYKGKADKPTLFVPVTSLLEYLLANRHRLAKWDRRLQFLISHLKSRLPPPLQIYLQAPPFFLA